MLLLIGAFGCLVVPFFALEYWHRWMFMLVYPFTFFAVNGFSKLLPKTSAERKTHTFSWFSNKKAAGTVLLTFSLGIAYLATPVLMVYASESVPSITATYLYFSTNPTVPYEDVNSVVQAMSWLNGNMTAVSCVVLQNAFLSWGQLYLDKSHVIVYFENDVNSAVSTAFGHGFSRVFFVWWNTPIGWYGVSVPQSFVSLQDFGRISVYAYEGGNVGGS
jgi:FtsH-binding integral membrane protein